MKSAWPELFIAALAIAATVAQDVALAPFYHSWQYIALLVMLVLAVGNAARTRLRAPLGIAFIGATVIAVAGLASALLGPDSVEVVRAPGSVAPIPGLRAAAFFGSADAGAIGAGSASILLRRPGEAEIAINAGRRRLVGGSLLAVALRPAAYVEARSARGDRVTVTQPSGTFLSPILLFPSTQAIAGKAYPFDTFALPALHRVVRAVYFDATQTAQLQHLAPGAAGHAAILYSMNDEAGHTLGITVASSGDETAIGGARLRTTVGSYPELIVASAPYPIALAIGFVLIATGLAWEWLREARIRAHPSAATANDAT